MKIIISLLLLLIVIFLDSCSDPSTSRRILEENGYTDIQITGYKWVGCSNDDDYTTGFQAISPAGALISGTVCSSMFWKNATIRFNQIIPGSSSVERAPVKRLVDGSIPSLGATLNNLKQEIKY